MCGILDGSVVMQETLLGGLIRYTLFSGLSGEDGTVTYGVGIDSSLEFDKGSSFVGDITDDLGYAKQLFERLTVYFVTPSVLTEIVEDFLCEKYSL